MIQIAQSHEHAENPRSLQDRAHHDEHSAAEDLADSLSELPETRLVAAPGVPKEVLLSDDPPDSREALRRAD